MKRHTLVAAVASGLLLAGSVTAQAAMSRRAAVPELPPLHEKYPEIFLPDGCSRIAPEGVEGAVSCPPDVDPSGDQAMDRQLPTRLRGFQGPGFVDVLTVDDVYVLEPTVRTGVSGTGAWTATGLIRNETSVAVEDVIANVVLRDATGREIGRAQGPILIGTLRPGEPGPFAITSNVSAAAVSDTEWSVAWGEATTPTARDLEITTLWTLPAGPRQPARQPGYEESDGLGAYPHVVYGMVQNLSSRAVRSPRVTAAWMDGEGRIARVVRGTVIQLGSRSPADVLASGEVPGIVDFYVTLDGNIGPELDGYELMLWAEGDK